MTTISIIENKLASVKKYLKILENYKKLEVEIIVNDVEKKGALERYLYLASQATIDLAEAVISYKGYQKPTTMSDAFYVLSEEKIISDELTKKMVKMVGFRNVVAHDYEKIDYEIVEKILKEGLEDIEKFLNTISEYLKI